MNSTDKKIFEFIALLKQLGEIRFDADFARAIGISKQHLNMIKNESRHFTPEHINAICKEFNLNANWLFNNDSGIFYSKKIKYDRVGEIE